MSILTTSSTRFSLGVAGIAFMLAAAGCGSQTSSINGKVTFRGKPVSGGSVIFYCQDQQIVRGIIDSDGNFTIPNVPKGNATVTVHSHTPIPAGFYLRQSLPPVNNGPIPPTVEVSTSETATTIPQRYNMPEESGLALNVDRRNQVFNIDLVP